MPEPVEAALLIAHVAKSLARYRRLAEVLVRLEGVLEDVAQVGSTDARIVVRPIDGCVPAYFATAVVYDPSPIVAELLAGVGQGGRITLIGLATVGGATAARLRMHPVYTINGVTVCPSR